MENASRALIISATVLLSVMLISFGTYLFATFGNYSKNINANLSAKQKQEFNAQFTKYEGGDPCTVYDIVTVINLAKDSNSKYEEYSSERNSINWEKDSTSYIYVTISGENQINETTNISELNYFINNHNSVNINTNKYKDLYTCTVHISKETGLVKSITFKKMN